MRAGEVRRNAGKAGAGRYRCRDNMMCEEGKTERENRGLYIQDSIPPSITISGLPILMIRIEASSTFQQNDKGPDVQGCARG